MALSKGTLKELPQDAVLLTEREALLYQRKIMYNWEKSSEVWAVQHTPSILSVMAIGTGLLINTYYRNKFRLGIYGRFSTYLPIIVIPALSTMSFHQSFVQKDILLNLFEKCPICVQLKATAFQIGFGVVHPVILAPLAASFFATRHYTYRLPLITEEPLQVLKLLWKFTKPIIPTLGLIAAGQALFTMYLTYKQQLQVCNIQLSLTRLSKQVEEKLSQ